MTQGKLRPEHFRSLPRWGRVALASRIVQRLEPLALQQLEPKARTGYKTAGRQCAESARKGQDVRTPGEVKDLTFHLADTDPDDAEEIIHVACCAYGSITNPDHILDAVRVVEGL